MKTWPALLVVLGLGAASMAMLSQPAEVTIGAYTTSLDGRTRAQSHNSELALDRIRGVLIPPHAVFSFNEHVGGFTRDRGFRRAPVSYNGQLIDSWGGGVCQTSTTLYNAALLSGMKIVERSRHRFMPSYVPPGRDAAVAFGAIDLKFQNPYDFPVRILGTIDGGRLTLRIQAPHALQDKPRIVGKVKEVLPAGEYVIGTDDGRGRVRNTGKDGYEVAIYRLRGDTREFISLDSYPSMSRVVEYHP